MDITKPPDWLVKLLPEGAARQALFDWGWYVILGVGGLLLLLILWTTLRALIPRKPHKVDPPSRALEERLTEYPEAPPRTGLPSHESGDSTTRYP